MTNRHEQTVRDIAPDKLIERAIRSAINRDRVTRPRWAVVMDVFGLGSTYAAQLCHLHGYDPDEDMKPFRRGSR